MFTNVSGLYSSGVISQREYLTQIASLQHTGMQNITAQNKKQAYAAVVGPAIRAG